MPSGREYHSPKPFKPPTLDEDEVVKMRAPPDLSELSLERGDDDSDDEDVASGGRNEPTGAFPGTAGEYSRSGSSAYY